MLHEFLSENRERLAEECRRKVAQRLAPKATAVELEHGVFAIELAATSG